MATKLTIENVKEMVSAMSENFRLLHGCPTMSTIEDPKTRGTLRKNKHIIHLLGTFENDGDDVNVAKKSLALTTSQALGIKCVPSDFNKNF